MKTIAEVMDRLTDKFQPETAAEMDAVFQIQIEDDQPYTITVRDQRCSVAQQQHDDPDVTLYMNSETFVEVIYGDLSGTTAFLSGRIRAEGDLMLATRLGKLFKR